MCVEREGDWDCVCVKVCGHVWKKEWVNNFEMLFACLLSLEGSHKIGLGSNQQLVSNLSYNLSKL